MQHVCMMCFILHVYTGTIRKMFENVQVSYCVSKFLPTIAIMKKLHHFGVKHIKYLATWISYPTQKQNEY